MPTTGLPREVCVSAYICFSRYSPISLTIKPNEFRKHQSQDYLSDRSIHLKFIENYLCTDSHCAKQAGAQYRSQSIISSIHLNQTFLFHYSAFALSTTHEDTEKVQTSEYPIDLPGRHSHQHRQPQTRLYITNPSARCLNREKPPHRQRLQKKLERRGEISITDKYRFYFFYKSHKNINLHTSILSNHQLHWKSEKRGAQYHYRLCDADVDVSAMSRPADSATLSPLIRDTRLVRSSRAARLTTAPWIRPPAWLTMLAAITKVASRAPMVPLL